MICYPERSVQFLTGLLICGFAADALAQQSEPIDFGRQIQPILAKRCLACHGPDKAEGGLRLNQKELAFSKLESGERAIVAHQPGQSELLRRISSTDDGVRMPPEGPPLPPQQVELIQRWIEQGADWKEHWAFEAPKAQQPPSVQNINWVANPIDAFILAKLEQNKLIPAPPADKVALLRRVTFDLIGLPPTVEEVHQFLADKTPGAFERVVDRLLQSPRYGEQWARHWLDIVRYADTNSFERDGPKPNAWRYRDYVIRSFNNDKPYDQFLREQLAGDEIPDAGIDGLIATGFYRLGLWDDEPADRQLAYYDGLDDVISTTAQGFLGLTVNCARCHDHKIDPIPQRDYYSMLAFFRGITPNGNPNPHVERPIFEDEASRNAYETATKARDEQLNQVQDVVTQIERDFREKLGGKSAATDQQPDLDELEYRFYRDTWEKLPDFDNLKAETVARLEKGYFDISPATRDFSFGFVFIGTLKVPEDGEYTFALDSDDGSRLTVNSQPILLYDGIHGTGHPQTAKTRLPKGRVPIRLDYFQGPSGAKELIVKWSGPGVVERFLSVPPEIKVNRSGNKIKGKDFAQQMAALGSTILGAQRYEDYVKQRDRLEQLKKQKVDAPMALCVTETNRVAPETQLLRRGNPQAPGETVVPAFLSVLGGGTARIAEPTATAQSSGRRLVLANWIASPDNRLTSRVMVNRIWQHLFGRGIVRTPNNFGLLGDRPTHPELLDWLAINFMQGDVEKAHERNSALSNGPWQMKRLIKLIVCSNSYCMSSQIPSGTNPIVLDPLNNLFWRHDMRRLGAEEIRDSILAVDGQLNTKMYGPGVFPEISDEVKAGQSHPGAGWGTSSAEDQSRRSIYVHVKRSLLLPILSDFDFADTDSSCAARFATTQPTQALGMLNGKFLNAQSAKFAQRLRKDVGQDVQKQVVQAYRLALCREPDHAMVDRGIKLIQAMITTHGLSEEKALEQFCLMTLNLNEFIYLD